MNGQARLVWLMALAAAACSSPRAASGGARDRAGADDGGTATPVTAARVVATAMERLIDGPGRTTALEQQKVVAPFVGRLLSLDVADGDHVKTGQIVGTLLAENSEAALQGAEAMARSASTPEEQADARRAVALAKASAVSMKLRAPEAGIVVSHGADEGALVAADEVLVTIAAGDSIAFVAQIVQSDLAAVRPGEKATVELAGRPGPLAGRVHAVLPTGNAGDLTSPVRIDLVGHPAVQIGIFGNVQIVVEVRPGVLAVPAAAVLRDDISGVSRIALVSEAGTVHWVEIKAGLAQRGLVQIESPPLRAGERVVTSGQVGLPEGARVTVQP